MDMTDASPDRAHLKAQITSAERFLKTMQGEEWADIKAVTTASLQAWKRQLQASQPTGTRLRGLQEARERKQNKLHKLRQVQAETAAELDSLDQSCELAVSQVRERFSQRATTLQRELQARAADLTQLQEELGNLAAQQAELLEQEATRNAMEAQPAAAPAELTAAMRILRGSLEEQGRRCPAQADAWAGAYKGVADAIQRLVTMQLQQGDKPAERPAEAPCPATQVEQEVLSTPPLPPFDDTQDTPVPQTPRARGTTRLRG